MRRLFNRLIARLSLFWRYFFLLVAVVLLFLAAFFFVVQSLAQSLQDSYLTQAQESFDQNCQAFSSSLFTAHSLPSALEISDDYSTASLCHTPESAVIPAFLAVRDTFTKQCTMLNLPSDCFLLFGRSNVCLTRNRWFPSREQCFSSHITFEDGGTALYAALEQSKSKLAFHLLPAQNVSVDGTEPEPHLTLLIASPNNRDVYGFLYSGETIRKQFHLDSLPESTSLQLTRSDGTVLFSHGASTPDDSNYILLTSTIPNLSCTATMGVPQSFFRQTTLNALTLPMFIFLLCLVAGVALCFLFSHISAKPFRRLIHTHSMNEDQPSAENELATIDSFLRTTQQRTATLHNMLLSSLLSRAVSGQPIRQDEYRALSVAFPQFQQPQRTAIIRDRQGNFGIHADNSMLSLFRDRLPDPFLCEYITPEETLIIFPAEQADFDLLSDCLAALNLDCENLPRFFCGVSSSFIGLDELTSSLRQAQFCISETSRRPITTFSEDAVGTDLSSGAAFDLKRFQQALSAWNQRELLAMLEQACNQPGPHPEELFYSLLFLLRDAALSGNMSFPGPESCSYLPSGTPATNLHQLCTVVDDLFRQKSALQLSDKQQLCEDLVRYIREHFSDPTLCLFSLSSQFNVSERFTHNAIQSITDMNFSNFLSQCRLQEAARLLQETDASINEVAEQCGYPAISTFYRNFKKYYQMTPADFKGSVQQPISREKEQL